MIERLWFLAELSLAWWIASLAGLLVLGAAPASVAVAEALRDEDLGMQVRPFRRVLGDAWTHRISANLRVAPLAAVQLAALLTLVLVFSGGAPTPSSVLPLVVLAVATLGWSSAAASLIVVHPRVRKQSPLRCWRIALLAPGAMPAATLATVLGLGIWALVCLAAPPLSVLFGPALSCSLARRTMGRRMETLIEHA